jgi:hypothetical protein
MDHRSGSLLRERHNSQFAALNGRLRDGQNRNTRYQSYSLHLVDTSGLLYASFHEDPSP